MSNLPDGHKVNSGTWDTDMALNSTMHQSGTYSLEFKNTATTNVRMETAMFPIEQNELYLFETNVRADDATKTMYCLLQCYEDDQTTTTESTNILPSSLNAANTWERWRDYWAAGDADTRWGKIIYGRNSASFTAYFDSVTFKRAVESFHTYLGSAQAVATGSTTVIEFDTPEEYAFGGPSDTIDHNHFNQNVTGYGYDDATNHRYNVLVSGFYVFSSRIVLDDLGDGKYGEIAIYRNGTSHKIGDNVINNSGGARDVVLQVNSGIIWCDLDDYIDVRVTHDHGANRNILAGSDDSYFSGFHVRG